ncbi:hypothetical protein HDV00_006187 [Rhizophlyctis rosea]|nr:hypothetical protein HDV00_006187 [Rhizophlyctis rosea]
MTTEAQDPPPYTTAPTNPSSLSLVPCIEGTGGTKRVFLISAHEIASMEPLPAGGAKLILAKDKYRERVAVYAMPQSTPASFRETFLPHFVALPTSKMGVRQPWIAVNPAMVVQVVADTMQADLTHVTVRTSPRFKSYLVHMKVAAVWKKLDPAGWARSLQLTPYMASVDMGKGNLITDALEE